MLLLGNSYDSAKLLPIAKEAGAIVIDGATDATEAYVFLKGLDNSELHDAVVDQHIKPMNSSSTMLSLLLKPLADSLGLKEATITLNEAVSGLGEEGASELMRETIALLNMRDVQPKIFNSQMAFNVHTAIGNTTANGCTTHEEEIVTQLTQVIGHDIAVSLTCMVSPVMFGHTACINVVCNPNTSLEDIRTALSDTGVIEINDDPEITPTELGTYEDHIIITRLRSVMNKPGHYAFIALANNATVGLSSNCYGILEAISKIA